MHILGTCAPHKHFNFWLQGCVCLARIQYAAAPSRQDPQTQSIRRGGQTSNSPPGQPIKVPEGSALGGTYWRLGATIRYRGNSLTITFDICWRNIVGVHSIVVGVLASPSVDELCCHFSMGKRG